MLKGDRSLSKMTGEPSVTPDPSSSPTRLMIPSPGPTTWDVIAQWVAAGILLACIVAVILFVFTYLPKVKKIKPFYASIAAVAILGGVFAFLVPVAFNSGFGKDDDGRVLRQLILYTTGGVLGVITLGETHRKNNQEKEKNENDHTRQVHAERRSRYTTAIEQLASTEGTIRLGGVYTLAGLVDEWLVDPYIEEEERKHESQVIINNLCAYIRSPFPLAEKIAILNSTPSPEDTSYVGDIYTEKSALRKEQEIRRTIFTEISMRASDTSENTKINHKDWRQFNFNFRESPIFYPLNKINLPGADFSGSIFYGEANFSESSFHGEAKFNTVKFKGKTFFIRTHFNEDAIFTRSIFENISCFAGSIFTGKTYFMGSIFVDTPEFTSLVEGKMTPAKFSSQIDYVHDDFVAHRHSPNQIHTTEYTVYNNRKITIPTDCKIFNP